MVEVTVVKKLNGVELHPAPDEGGQAKFELIYNSSVPELGMSSRNYLNWRLHMTAEQIQQVEHLIDLADQAVQEHG